MNIVEENGGLQNTLSYDIGYAACSPKQKLAIDQGIGERRVCPKCGEKATYQTPDGTFWDSNAHYWRPRILPGM